jgi:cyclic-di-GMP phosphodiesterase TipF (flagellum assembly factor)
MRLGAVFVAICIVLIAASAGLAAYSGFGLGIGWSALVSLCILAALSVAHPAVQPFRARSPLGDQLADLSGGVADLARQVSELGRRLGSLEGRVQRSLDKPPPGNDPLVVWIGELGTLVKQLAESVAEHETKLAEHGGLASSPSDGPATSAEVLFEPSSPAAKGSEPGIPAPSGPVATTAPPGASLPSTPIADTQGPSRTILTPNEPPAGAEPPMTAQPQPATASATPAIDRAAAAAAAAAQEAARIEQAQKLATIRHAIDAHRIDLYLQPIVTLPQRKVRYYEAMSRLRTDAGDLMPASDFVALAEAGGLISKIDNLVVFRCVQVLRRLLLKNRELGLFCNISGATLNDDAMFPHLLEFLEANRAIAPSLVLEFKQSTLRAAGPMMTESFAALAQRGFRFSLDNLTDLRIDPRDLAERGFRFIKMPAALLLNRTALATVSDIHPADLSDLLARHGIDLVAEKIESEGTVVDLLDYGMHYGQGFLFSPPRPVRPEALQGVPDRGDVTTREAARVAAPKPQASPPPMPASAPPPSMPAAVAAQPGAFASAVIAAATAAPRRANESGSTATPPSRNSALAQLARTVINRA